MCVLAQGFSVKVHLVEQEASILQLLIRVLELEMISTFILDTFAGENAIKHMAVHHLFVFFVFWHKDSHKTCHLTKDIS